MATQAHDQQAALLKAFEGTYSTMAKMERASKGITENLGDLIHQIQPAGRGLKGYLMETIRIPKMLSEAAKAIGSPTTVLLEATKEHQNVMAQAVLKVNQLQSAYKNLANKRDKAARDMRQQIKDAKLEVAIGEERLRLEAQKYELHAQSLKVFGKILAVEFMVVATFRNLVKESFAFNQALLDTNSKSAVRFGLFKDTLDVQARLGASTERMVGAAKALRGAGFLVRGEFKSTLEAVVQMEESLGVSAENATQLARIFQINLRTPVRGVADDITTIAHNTALAADEAARFATEIGKSLRLLGPGVPQAREVTRYVAMMAARMKDVGGDASEVVRLFGEMTKGTAQGFLLRGMTGVGAPGSVGTQAGAQQAMEGVGRLIDKIVRSAPGTRLYVAQLEAASQMLGISTESVRLYRDMLEESRKPLDAATTLQRHWERQTALAGESLSKLIHGVGALMKQALLPLMEYGIAPTIRLFNRLVMGINNSKVAFGIAVTALYAGIGVTIYAFGKLTYELFKTAIAAKVLAQVESQRQLQLGLGAVAGRAGLLANMAKLGGPLAMFSRAISSMIPLLSNPFVIGGTLALGVGWFIGRQFIRPWLEELIGIVKPKKDTTKTAYLGLTSGDKALSRRELDAMVRHAMVTGGVKAGLDLFRNEAWRLKGIDTSTPGWRASRVREQLDDYVTKVLPQIAADVRERIALSTVTADREETARRDQEMIEIAREQLTTFKNEVPAVASKLIKDRRSDADRREAEEQKKSMLNKTSGSMTSDPWAKTKDERFDRFQGFMR